METINKKKDNGKSPKVDFKELNKSIEQKNRIIKDNAIVHKKDKP